MPIYFILFCEVLSLTACKFSEGYVRFSKSCGTHPRIVEGFLMVAERLFRKVLSKGLGTQKFGGEKRVP